MRDPESSTGNGATAPALQEPLSIAQHGRQIHHDAATLAAEVRVATADLERYLADRVDQRPYGTLGVAAGIGYVLGGGLSARFTVVLLGAAARLATALAVREVGARLSPRDSASLRPRAPEDTSGAVKERS